MNQYDQHHQVPVAYPPPPTSYPPPAAERYGGPYVMAPPPIGYPSKDGNYNIHAAGNKPIETTTRGDGLLKGCLAGLCCCFCLDICF